MPFVIRVILAGMNLACAPCTACRIHIQGEVSKQCISTNATWVWYAAGCVSGCGMMLYTDERLKARVGLHISVPYPYVNVQAHQPLITSTQ